MLFSRLNWHSKQKKIFHHSIDEYEAALEKKAARFMTSSKGEDESIEPEFGSKKGSSDAVLLS